MRHAVLPLVSTLALASLAACSSKDVPAASGTAPTVGTATKTVAAVSAPAPAPSSPAPATHAGNAENGGALVLKFECNRCHEGTGHKAAAFELDCVKCHEDISTGRFGAGTPKIATWKERVQPYRYTPSLESAGQRLRPEWIVRFLLQPSDLRPHLTATMPRLQMTPDQAADIAAYVTRDAKTNGDADPLTSAGNPAHGRALMEEKSCGGCHEFTGAPAFAALPDASAKPESRRKAVLLAPDLRHTRERFVRANLVAWLENPPAMKAGTPMPTHSFTRDEATDVAAYLLRTELAPAKKANVEPRLPVLSRPVTYEEVEERVLSVTCRHCHGNPDVAGGDGGPGNTGGFGFEPRRLDLSTYASASSGYLADDHERHSVFEKLQYQGAGTPMLVAALDARRHEEAGDVVPGVRGMPLGLPAVTREDVQLVETWIAQGRPRRASH